jgi:O-antigen/teichoic acid export membrane protein
VQVRKTMRICLVISIATAPIFVIFAGLILKVFGHDYVSATAALAILGFATYPQTIKAHYVAIARVRGRMHNAALWTLVGGCLEVGFSAVGAEWHGLTGLAVAYLIAATLEAILFSPSVFGVIRKPASPDVAVQNG